MGREGRRLLGLGCMFGGGSGRARGEVVGGCGFGGT